MFDLTKLHLSEDNIDCRCWIQADGKGLRKLLSGLKNQITESIGDVAAINGILSHIGSGIRLTNNEDPSKTISSWITRKRDELKLTFRMAEEI